MTQEHFLPTIRTCWGRVRQGTHPVVVSIQEPDPSGGHSTASHHGDAQSVATEATCQSRLQGVLSAPLQTTSIVESWEYQGAPG